MAGKKKLKRRIERLESERSRLNARIEALGNMLKHRFDLESAFADMERRLGELEKARKRKAD